MKDIVRIVLNEIRTDRMKRRRMRTVLLVLSLLVATSVLWQLKITGITMTGEALCGLQEYQHTESCLEAQQVCDQEETDGHQHLADCHRVLCCAEEAHEHEDACYEMTELPVCGREEAQEHHHSEACFAENYICGYAQVHTHTPLCYSNAEMDLESSSDWEQTIPALTHDDDAADLVAVARSQLGYQESLQNFKLADDEITRMGYTRYGEWYGNPYGDWDAMFVSFCLYYAEHPAYEALKASGTEVMRLAAENAGLYRSGSGAIPSRGDLVFLDKDENGVCDALGIVSSCQNGSMLLVQGDCEGIVAETQWSTGNGVILGYAALTQPAADAISESKSFTLTNDSLNPEGKSADVSALSDEGTVTVTFVISEEDYTDDPGNHTTHLAVYSTDAFLADGGLTFNKWGSTGKYQVSGTGTLAAVSVPAGTAFADSGYAFPNVSVVNMTPEVDRTHSYASMYNWVTDAGMICNNKTVFTEDTTLSLYLYDRGTNCGLNWVCNCDAGGSHSVTYFISGFGTTEFSWGQSLSAPYIPTAAAVNSSFKSEYGCTVGPEKGMEFKGWYVKDSNGNEIDFVPGLPILASYVDPDSDGHSVKVYARWETPEVHEDVTATFVNGTETTTAVLEKGQPLGDHLPQVTAPEGLVFLGWQIGDSNTYATAETVIEADTTYTAVFADCVKLTFMNGEDDASGEFQVVDNVPRGALLLDYLPAEEPEYTGTSELPVVFTGWGFNEGEIFSFVTETTTADTDMVLYAVFEEVAGYDIYLHDIAPDGVTDYELDGQDVEISQRFISHGMNLADEFAADPYTMLRDDAPVTELKWYVLDDQGIYVPYDLTTAVTSELHLYTFNYSVTMICKESENRSGLWNLFPVASAAEVTVDGNTLTLILREGEKPTLEDLVIDDVDYSVYNWHFEDDAGNEQTLTLADVLNHGVTKNLEATAAKDDLAIVGTAIAKVRFQVIVNRELVDLGQQEITVYLLKEHEKDSYSISQETLKSVYGPYGFTVEDWLAHPYSLPQKVIGYGEYYANHPIREANGLYYNPSVGEAIYESEVLYLPGMQQQVTGQTWDAFRDSRSFYTVTVSDPEGIVYPDETVIPVLPYAFAGESYSVTLPAPEGISWNFQGINTTDITETGNGDGTKTYTFSNVNDPIVLTPSYSGLEKSDKYINFYVYVNGTRVNVASGTYPVYRINSKHYLAAGQLEKIYGSKYHFRADQLTDSSQRYFPHTDAGSNTAWADWGLMEHNGIWFSPILNSDDTRNCDVYYAPGYTGPNSSYISNLAYGYSFYTVTVQDPNNLVYAAGEALPEPEYAFRGTSATVTVKTPVDPDDIPLDGGAYCWSVGGEILTDGILNDDGTTTYVIENVTAPVVLSPVSNFVTVRAEDASHLIYQVGETLPTAYAVIGQTAEITVKTSSECAWLANGKSIEGGIYNSDTNTITYAFTDVTEDITLGPVKLLDSVAISYNINLQHTNINSTVPQIKGGTEYADSYDGGDYIVLTPSRTQYTTVGASTLNTVEFLGWRVLGTDVILPEGAVLTQAEVSQFGPSVMLYGAWNTLHQTHTVSFYVNLELQVADFENSTDPTPSGNYTNALYGTEVKIETCPQCDEGRNFNAATIIEGSSASATAATDAEIRQLPNGVTGFFMDKDRDFTLGTFPDDGQMMRKIVDEQNEMIREFENSAYFDPEDPSNVTAYRAVKNEKGEPVNKIICTSDSTGQLHYIPTDELTTQNYAIRWFVFKYEPTDGWHIDGVLVKKQAQLTVTKTFYGDDAAVKAVKDGYTIDVVGINEENPGSLEGRPTLYTLTLEPASAQQNDPATTQIEQGYRLHNEITDTYTWVVNLTADWEAWLYEQDHTSSDENIVTLSEYTAYNFRDDKYNQNRTTYSDSNGVCVAVKAHGIDQQYTTFETVAFYNTYLPSAAVPISKVDENGKPLTGVTFTLQGINQNTPVPAKIWKDAENVYHYRPDSVQEQPDPSWELVDTIAVDEMGYALVMGLKDNDLNYSFELTESSAPEGYNSILGPIGFTIGENGSIQLREDVQNSDMVQTPDHNTIHVTNTSQVMSVTAEKVWTDGTADQSVTLQLMLDDTAIPGKVVELDGIPDEPGEGQTDGYEFEAWKVKWNDLPAYTGGTKAEYKIKETAINGLSYDTNYDDGYADYHVIVEDMEYTAMNGEIPTAGKIVVRNRKQMSGLEFTKTNEYGETLPGAVFQLYRDEACTKTYGKPATSNDFGIVSFGDLATGTYYMKEVTAPENYLLSDTVYTVKVHAGKTSIHVYGSENAIEKIINESEPATLYLKKVDNHKNPLSGAAFEIWKQNGISGEYEKISREINGEVTTTFVVDDTGELVISGLTRGNYKLVEAYAPAGYYRLTEEINFQVNKSRIVCSSTSRLWSFDGTTITVVNVAGSELPETGGMGTGFSTMAGLLMMAVSLLYGLQLWRKRERGAA